PGGGLSLRSSTTTAPSATAGEIAQLSTAPHILVRHTLVDSAYNKLSLVTLADPKGRRLTAGLACERIAFAAGRSICLQADRGVFTTYRALLINQDFKTLNSWKLDGGPSRTRVAS